MECKWLLPFSSRLKTQVPSAYLRSFEGEKQCICGTCTAHLNWYTGIVVVALVAVDREIPSIDLPPTLVGCDRSLSQRDHKSH